MRINNEKMSRINLSVFLINFNFSLVARRTTNAKMKNIVPQNKTSRLV